MAFSNVFCFSFIFFSRIHHNTAAVYQVTRLGHEHCDITEGELLDITPLVVDGKKLVTLYDKDLTEGINLLIGELIDFLFKNIQTLSLSMPSRAEISQQLYIVLWHSTKLPITTKLLSSPINHQQQKLPSKKNYFVRTIN